MRVKQAKSRVLSFVLAFSMLIGLMPSYIFASNTTSTSTTTETNAELTGALEEAKTFIDALTIHNSSNDPSIVVSNFGTHFTWDNEKREESSESYLFDWSYYNGVVFEGLDYVYDVTGETKYADYVTEYLSTMIASDGTWATCSNNSNKEAAGYVAYHGADCYKTASLLLDYYKLTKDSRYLTMAETLYADLTIAAKNHSLSNAGNNWSHTWESDSDPDLWLDGLYMILPFRAEYAAYIGDTKELDLIVDRLQWVSDNMYDESTGLFYHAANSGSDHSNTFWLRSLGWYAAAIVDVMDVMSDDNLETMKTQLVKLVDGMKAIQDANNGMWLNNLAASQSDSNPYETSGTALITYAVMKAVNHGWLDESYGNMAINAFVGICNEKLDGTTLTDICFKGTPGSSNATFYDNEGKGVGPFIMLYAEVLEYVKGASTDVGGEVLAAEEGDSAEDTTDTNGVSGKGNPYEGLEDATEYPEYPNDGAVRIDKNATANAEVLKNTGVTHVELNVAGISVKKGVDVVLVADISNSMAWVSGQKNVSPSNGETTKWQDLKTAAGTFIDVLLADNEDGTNTTNTVSFVMFGGYDADRNKNASSSSYSGYADSVQTVFTSESVADIAKSQINAYEITGNDSDGYTMTKDGKSMGNPQGGTNYDYAFLETAAAIAQLKHEYATENSGKSYDKSGREIYVVFMTDGAPDHYNQLYYKTRNNTQFDYYALYRNETDSLISDYFAEHTVPTTYGTLIQRQTNGYYFPRSTNIGNEAWINWIQSDSLYAAEYVKSIARVNSITSVGFDLANGAFSTYEFSKDVLASVLANLAGANSCEVFLTSEAEKLNGFYKELATTIRYAGTLAQVTDIIDSNFTLQMAKTSGSGENTATLSNFNMEPKITITTYELWTKGETEDTTLIGTRKGTGDVLETVTFNENGTEAYSDKVENSTKNILSIATDGTVRIEAFYFTYTKTPEGEEKFTWNIGNITDKEIVLGFDVYLKGSLEGDAKEGIYYTNENATLEYIDIHGKHATQVFPVPAVSWGGATTTIRFYLVNEKGEPVNRAGDVVPWANRVYVGDPVIVTLNLNDNATIPAQEIKAASYVPEEYFLYDINASYTVQTASGDGNTIIGAITVSEPSSDAEKTTQDNLGNFITQTGAQTTIEIDAEETYYTWSIVGFGVRYDLSTETVDTPLEGDRIVMDYGKAIHVDVLANDKEEIAIGFTGELVGFVAYNANTNLKNIQISAGSHTYRTANGDYSIVDGKAAFQLTTMLSTVEKVFCVVRVTETENPTNYYYLYEELDIIPATSIYYETDFAGGIFKLTTTAVDSPWKKETSPVSENVADGPQNDGTIGVNQVYGYDSTYENDTDYSNGSSWFVIGQGVKLKEEQSAYTEAKFSFTGTGFDLISRTGAEQGAIRVNIYSDPDRINQVKSVTVLNKSERKLELYQIPVVSVEGLDYGTYYVTIGVNAAYRNETYPALSRGGEFYFDAIRVFNPAATDAEALEAYEEDGEANAVVQEVRDILISADTFEALESEEANTTGVVFVDRTYGTDEKGVDVTDYTTIGPNNEVYLSKGQGIAFLINAAHGTPASVDIGAKSADGQTARLNATMISFDDETIRNDMAKDIAAAASLYYNLMESDTLTMSDIFGIRGKAYVVITNTGNGILSITDIKVAYDTSENTSEVETLAFLADTQTVSLARSFMLASEEEKVERETPEVEEIAPETERDTEEMEAETEEPEPETEEMEAETKEPEVTVSNYDILSAEFTSSSCPLWNTAVMTVVTTQDVTDLEVSNRYGWDFSTSMGYKDQEDGTRVWDVKVTAYLLGTQKYRITGYGADGTAGASATVSIKVTIF